MWDFLRGIQNHQVTKYSTWLGQLWSFCVFVFCLIVVVTIAEADVCIISDDTDQCPKTWSLNTPSINVTHRLSLPVNGDAEVMYGWTVQNSYFHTMCQYKFFPDGECMELIGRNCLDCRRIYNKKIAVSKFFISDIDMTKNRSLLQYMLTVHNYPEWNTDYTTIKQFEVMECSKSIGNAVAFNCSNDQCGYGCTCRFRCVEPFTNNSLKIQDEYRCTDIAKWSPRPPICTVESFSLEAKIMNVTEKEVDSSSITANMTESFSLEAKIMNVTKKEVDSSSITANMTESFSLEAKIMNVTEKEFDSSSITANMTESFSLEAKIMNVTEKEVDSSSITANMTDAAEIWHKFCPIHMGLIITVPISCAVLVVLLGIRLWCPKLLTYVVLGSESTESWADSNDDVNDIAGDCTSQPSVYRDQSNTPSTVEETLSEPTDPPTPDDFQELLPPEQNIDNFIGDVPTLSDSFQRTFRDILSPTYGHATVDRRFSSLSSRNRPLPLCEPTQFSMLPRNSTRYIMSGPSNSSQEYYSRPQSADPSCRYMLPPSIPENRPHEMTEAQPQAVGSILSVRPSHPDDAIMDASLTVATYV